MESVFIKIRNMPKGAKASLAYVIASLITQGFNFLATPIYTRILTTADMGVVSSYSTYSSVIGTIVGLGLVSGSFSIGMKEYPDKREQYTSSVFTLNIISAAIFFVLFFIIKDSFSRWMGLGTEYLLLMCLGFMLNPGKSMWFAKNRYELKYKASVFVTIISSFLTILISVYEILKYRENPAADLALVRLVSAAVVTLSFSIVIDLYILLKGKQLINLTYWKVALGTSIPLMIHSLAKVIFDSSDRIMILKMVGKSEVGIYGTLYIFSSISLILWQAINGSLVPFIFVNIQNRNYSAIRRVCNSMLLIYATACISLMLIAPDVVKFMTTKEYLQGIYIMPPVAAGIFFTALYNMYSTVILYYKKTKYIMYGTCICAAVNIILNYVMIRRFGYMAAAYTTLFSFILLSIIQYIFMLIVSEEPDFYDERSFLGLSLVILLFSLIANVLYSNDLVRYIIIALLLLLLLINYKKIIIAIKKIQEG